VLVYLVYRVLNISEELDANNLTSIEGNDWNIDEAIGMAYLVDQICGARKSRFQFAPQKNVTDFNLIRDNYERLLERYLSKPDNIFMIDTLNSTEMTDKIIPFIKRVKSGSSLQIKVFFINFNNCYRG
jgi:hypothetical protein